MTMANSDPEHAWELLIDDAARGAEQVSDLSKKLPKLWGDVRRLLTEATDPSDHARTQEIFAQAEESHQDVVARLAPLIERAHALIASYRADPPQIAVLNIEAHLGRVEPEELADAGLLALCKRAFRTVESAPAVWSIHVALAHIPVHALVCAHYDALNMFLGRPTGGTRVKSAADEIVRGAVRDGIGVFVPVLGTLEAIYNVSRPQLDREIARIHNAVTEVNKAYRFEETMRGLRRFANLAESCVVLAENGLAEFAVAFKHDSDWLTNALDGATRDPSE